MPDAPLNDCLVAALERFDVVEAVEAESHGNARYIGGWLARKKSKISVDSKPAI